MERQHAIAGSPEVRVPVRVRGLSHEERYFDEQTSTTRLTQDFIVIRLPKRVDLDFEVHVLNMRTQVGGIYRVVWINIRPEQGSYSMGLELLDSEGEIWEPDTIPHGLETGEAAAVVLLECQRCSHRVSTSLPEAEVAAVGEGFIISRHCDTCKATTGWAFCAEEPVTVEVPLHGEETLADAAVRSNAPAPTPADLSKDQRQKGRAPINMVIKIIRTKYGQPTYDVCQTINVSRTGAYFTTEKGYEPGEIVEVILPYHPDSIAIPVQARVVRQDERPGTYQKRVAIQLAPGTNTGH